MILNEPAFPNPHLATMQGILLRDYFAIRTLAAIITNGSEQQEIQQDRQEQVKRAYHYADAMLEARGK